MLIATYSIFRIWKPRILAYRAQLPSPGKKENVTQYYFERGFKIVMVRSKSRATYECLTAVDFCLTINLQVEMLEENVGTATASFSFHETAVSAFFLDFRLHHDPFLRKDTKCFLACEYESNIMLIEK